MRTTKNRPKSARKDDAGRRPKIGGFSYEEGYGLKAGKGQKETCSKWCANLGAHHGAQKMRRPESATKNQHMQGERINTMTIHKTIVTGWAESRLDGMFLIHARSDSLVMKQDQTLSPHQADSRNSPTAEHCAALVAAMNALDEDPMTEERMRAAVTDGFVAYYSGSPTTIRRHEMMKTTMQVANLTGALLDYWTGRANGIPAANLDIRQVQRGTEMICVRSGLHRYDPSTNWTTGGPLLDQYEIGFGIYAAPREKYFAICGKLDQFGDGTGDKHLVAACRAIVASAFGAEVPEVPACTPHYAGNCSLPPAPR